MKKIKTLLGFSTFISSVVLFSACILEGEGDQNTCALGHQAYFPSPTAPSLSLAPAAPGPRESEGTEHRVPAAPHPQLPAGRAPWAACGCSPGQGLCSLTVASHGPAFRQGAHCPGMFQATSSRPSQPGPVAMSQPFTGETRGDWPASHFFQLGPCPGPGVGSPSFCPLRFAASEDFPGVLGSIGAGIPRGQVEPLQPS